MDQMIRDYKRYYFMTFIHARVHEVDIQVIQKLQQLAEVFDSINIRVDY